MVARTVMFERLSEIEATELHWLWPGRIPVGLTLVAGDPGVGKSFFTADLAARVTRGAQCPVGGEIAPKGAVVILSGEDAVDQVIRPESTRPGSSNVAGSGRRSGRESVWQTGVRKSFRVQTGWSRRWREADQEPRKPPGISTRAQPSHSTLHR